MTILNEIPLTVHPSRKRVLLQRDEVQEHTDSGLLYLPDIAIRPSATAFIHEVGSDVKDVEPGKTAVVPQFAGTEIKVRGVWYLLLPESEIMAYVED